MEMATRKKERKTKIQPHKQINTLCSALETFSDSGLYNFTFYIYILYVARNS